MVSVPIYLPLPLSLGLSMYVGSRHRMADRNSCLQIRAHSYRGQLESVNAGLLIFSIQYHRSARVSHQY